VTSKCPGCPKKFRDPFKMLTHYRKKHPQLVARRKAAREAKRARSSPDRPAPSGARRSGKREIGTVEFTPTGGTWHPPGCRCDGCK
jgi:hypothetical protein